MASVGTQKHMAINVWAAQILLWSLQRGASRTQPEFFTS